MNKPTAEKRDSIDSQIEHTVDMAAARGAEVKFCHLLKTLQDHCSGTVLVDQVLAKVVALAKRRGVEVDLGTIK
jgi:hypothetical protein